MIRLVILSGLFATSSGFSAENHCSSFDDNDFSSDHHHHHHRHHHRYQSHQSCQTMQHAYNKAAQKTAYFEMAAKEERRVEKDDFGSGFFNQPPYDDDVYHDFNRTITLIFTEKIFVSTIRNSTDEEAMNTLKQHSFCLKNSQKCSMLSFDKCRKDEKYRTLDGSCNNLENPTWGKSNTPYDRLVSPNYSDGIFEIRKSVVNEMSLPEASLVSNNGLIDNSFKCRVEARANFFGVMYGQAMAHDHGMRLMFQSKEGGFTKTCCNKDYTKPLNPLPFGCNPFKYDKNNPFLPKELAYVECMNFIRSQITFPHNCTLDAAMPVNFVSHHLDLSIIYGSSSRRGKTLRSYKDGKLRTHKGNFLPRSCHNPEENCYQTGDDRALGNLPLGIIHTAYHRLHNIICDEFLKLNLKWSEEKRYQEARRANIAFYQNHVMDWLRVFVGNNATAALRPNGNGYSGKYDPKINPSSTNEYSHSVLRTYHTNLVESFNFTGSKNETIKTFPLHEIGVGLVPLETYYDEILRGMIFAFSRHNTFSNTTRYGFFSDNNKHGVGVDLVSTDLFIGRDVGIQPFYIYVLLCTGRHVKSFDDLKVTIPAESVDRLRKIYKSVYDVDTYAALALEEKCDSYMGAIGKCLMVKQFEKIKSGDRFFYSLPNGAYPFTLPQLTTIYNFDISKFICTVTNFDEVPTRGFEVIGATNLLVPCKRSLNMIAWNDINE